MYTLTEYSFTLVYGGTLGKSIEHFIEKIFSLAPWLEQVLLVL